MNKIALTTLALLTFACSAWAEYHQVPAAQLPAYKEAVALALSQSSLTCNRGNPTDWSPISADAAEVGRLGDQPLLKFSMTSGNVHWTLEYSTNEAGTSIRNINFQHFRPSRVNNGTLAAPNIIDGWSIISTVQCRELLNRSSLAGQTPLVNNTL